MMFRYSPQWKRGSLIAIFSEDWATALRQTLDSQVLPGIGQLIVIILNLQDDFELNPLLHTSGYGISVSGYHLPLGR